MPSGFRIRTSACALFALALIPTVDAAINVVSNSGFCPGDIWRGTKWPGNNRPNGLTLWTSFCDKNNDNVGRIEFQAFPAPSVLNLYLTGYPGLPGRRLLLKNAQSGEERELIPPSTPGDDWRFNTLPVPHEWIGQPVQLVAEDRATGFEGWLGFSLPFLPPSPPSSIVIDTSAPPGSYCLEGAYAGAQWPSGSRPARVSRVWGSFCKSGDKDTGWGASQPLAASSFLNLYVAGYPDTPGLRLAVENLQTGQQLPLHVPASPAEHWQFLHFPLPGDWRGQPVRVLSSDQATGARGWAAFSELLPTTLADRILDAATTLGLLLLAFVLGAIALLKLGIAKPLNSALSRVGERVAPRHAPEPIAWSPKRRWTVLMVAWILTGISVLPVIFHWPAPPSVDGSERDLLIDLGYFFAFAICYIIYRAESRRLTRSRALTLVLVVFLLTAITNHIHNVNVDQATGMFPMPDRVWQLDMHNQVMQLNPAVLPHSYRFLPNCIVRWMELARLDFDSARDLYRLLCGLLLFYAIYKYARLFSNFTGAIIAMLLVAAIYPISFEHYAGQLTDPLSHLSFVLAFIFLETGEFALLLSTLLIGSLAKETVLALAGYYVLFCRKERNYPLKAAVLCVAGVAVFLGVRIWVLHGAMNYQQASNVTPDHILENWRNPDWQEPFLLAVAALLPFLALAWKETAGSLKRMALFLLPVLFVSSLLFSWLREIRNFMPLVFVLAVIAGRYLSRPTPIGAAHEASQEPATVPTPSPYPQPKLR